MSAPALGSAALLLLAALLASCATPTAPAPLDMQQTFPLARFNGAPLPALADTVAGVTIVDGAFTLNIDGSFSAHYTEHRPVERNQTEVTRRELRGTYTVLGRELRLKPFLSQTSVPAGFTTTAIYGGRWISMIDQWTTLLFEQ